MDGAIAGGPGQAAEPSPAARRSIRTPLGPSYSHPTAGPQTARQIGKKEGERHDGPGKGCQAVVLRPAASLIGVGMGPAHLPVPGQGAVPLAMGEPGLRQRAEYLQF